jgi:hypothetical protein
VEREEEQKGVIEGEEGEGERRGRRRDGRRVETGRGVKGG